MQSGIVTGRLYTRQVARVGTVVKNYHVREKLAKKDGSGCRLLHLECEFCKRTLQMSLYELLRRQAVCECRRDKDRTSMGIYSTIFMHIPGGKIHYFRLDPDKDLAGILLDIGDKSTIVKEAGLENVIVFEFHDEVLRKLGDMHTLTEEVIQKRGRGRPRRDGTYEIKVIKRGQAPEVLEPQNLSNVSDRLEEPPKPPEPPKEELSWPSFLLEDPKDYIWFTAQAPQNRFPPKYITDWVEEANYDPKTSKLFSVATEEGLRVHYKTLPREEAPVVSSRMPTWSFDDDDDTPF